ncbi:5-formyltetrahydrofolate cyclo-ligase [Candidatus Electrothrix marina]|uniref:5-formyltetrahydrofolate cyclo-ligase n=2 Tax=Candidatus Electrothrix marina TaxID=1859130 RepID=A0A3S3QVT1_9BACT|nr:5-formyltetrahydrofolate cyclo-ligase [Candidatus Electrothrix marina]
MNHRSQLRKERLAERGRLDAAQRRNKSEQIQALLLEQPVIVHAKHLFIYVHFCSEVETLALIEHCLAKGKTVSVPVTLRKESRLLAVQITDPATQLEPGCFGIPEPTDEQIAHATIDPTQIDAVLVPGSVFDPLGGRLGYGGGYYDRFLTQDAPQARRIGLAYAVQIVEQVPMEAHDQYMDMIITEQQAYACKRLREEV